MHVHFNCVWYSSVFLVAMVYVEYYYNFLLEAADYIHLTNWSQPVYYKKVMDMKHINERNLKNVVLADSVIKVQYPFQIVNEWKYLDFEYPTYELRKNAIQSGKFVLWNNLPLGIDVYKQRIFLTIPRWKDGIPATLGTLKYPPTEISPPLKPYPNWESHSDPYQPDCHILMSVYRTYIDNCQRLWLIDAGIVNASANINQICPPKIIAYDLNTDQIVLQFEFPSDQVKQDSLHSNILVNVDSNHCDNAYVYVTDVWRYGLLVYSMAKNRSWRVSNFNFHPSPEASDFELYGFNFQWLDGIFGMSLGTSKQGERVLYFHPMASFKEYMVPTSLLHDENIWIGLPPVQIAKLFVPIGDRGALGQSTTSGMSYNGVQFFTQVHRDDVACWNTARPYIRANIHFIIGDSLPNHNITSKKFIQFPNDMKLDQNYGDQGIWVISNRLPIYLYDQLNNSEINFRILYSTVNNLIRNTVCDPDVYISTSVSTRVVKEGQCY